MSLWDSACEMAQRPALKEVEDAYWRVVGLHYTIFCKLASALHAGEALKSSYDLSDPKRRVFEHWDAFERGMEALRSALFLADELTRAVCALPAGEETWKGKGAFDRLRGWVDQTAREVGLGGSEALRRLQAVEAVREWGNASVHWFRQGHRWTAGRFQVPVKPLRSASSSQSLPWPEVARVASEWRDSEELLKDSCGATMSALEALWELLSPWLGQRLKLAGASVDYESVTAAQEVPSWKPEVASSYAYSSASGTMPSGMVAPPSLDWGRGSATWGMDKKEWQGGQG